MDEEERLNLLVTLRKKGLSTRDIMGFVKNQADIRQVNKGLDKTVARLAMTSKIKDCKGVIRLHRSKKRDLKLEYLNTTDGNRYRMRRIIKSARVEHNLRIQEKQTKMEKKIRHLQLVQEKLDATYMDPPRLQEPTKTPDRLKEFQGLSIFGLPTDLPTKQEPLGPYVCSNNIELSEGERAILSRDPKYSLMMQCSEEDFDTESERALALHRYGENAKKDKIKKKKNSVITYNVNNGNSNESHGLNHNGIDREKILMDLWKESEHRHIYNPFDKFIKFSSRRPTDYKLNTRVKLPKPLDLNGAFLCESRRKAYKDTFNEYKNMCRKASDLKKRG